MKTIALLLILSLLCLFFSGQVQAQTLNTYQPFDCSSTITTGNTAQLLCAGAVPQNGWEIDNPDATNDLWVSDTTTALANAAGSIRVPANGGKYTTPPNSKPLGPISIVGGVTGQKFTARRF